MTTHRTLTAALQAALRAFERTGRKAHITCDRIHGSGHKWTVSDPEGVTA